MTWKKGESGNPGGRAKGKPISDMYRKLLVQNPEKLERFCMKQIDLACAGDTNAIKEITDRVEGKALQSLDVSDARKHNGAERLAELFSTAVKADSGETSTGRTQ